ncbi:MAG: preprotein translocase subunit SecG [Bacteroidetes bacterium]|nr:preprotein translocase subunit SecG [Bacteroidota bacterium]
MGTLISVIIVIVSILLILVVLVQNSKGGGLASTFSSSNQVMGVRKTADFLEKATWTLAIALLVLSLLSTAYTKPTAGSSTAEGGGSKTKEIGSTKSDGGAATNNALPLTTDSAK